MEQKSLILEKAALLRPCSVLDMGCGCGGFTVKLGIYCAKITAIDLSEELINRSKKENQKPNITYLCMDGRGLKYPDGSFDLVIERASLHHILEWKRVLDEMVRVSSRHVLIEEPIDDPRSKEKSNSIRAHKFFLEVQKEAGYAHYDYIPLDLLLEYFREHNIVIETQIARSDELITFDDYFGSYGSFAEKTRRKEYWLDRLNRFRGELGTEKLCESDVVLIHAKKKRRSLKCMAASSDELKM